MLIVGEIGEWMSGTNIRSGTTIGGRPPLPNGGERIAVLPIDAFGGDRGIRTPDLRDANAALSQLSYIPSLQRNYSTYGSIIKLRTNQKGADENHRLPIIHHTESYYLALANAEHLSTTSWASALSRRLAILHGNSLGILHLFLSSTLYTISLHHSPPFCS
jgi:hypothetical protein